MAIINKLRAPLELISGKLWKNAQFAVCTNKRTGKMHTQIIPPWTHGFNKKQVAAQKKMREANRRVHEILSNPELRKPYEEEWKRSAPEDERRRLRDYVFMKVYASLGG